METQKEEHVLSMFEVCELLNKSKRSVSRYIRRGLLNPKSIKSRQGTLEYRFSEAEVKNFKIGQPRQEYTEGTRLEGHERQNEESIDLKGYSQQTRREPQDTQDRLRKDDNQEKSDTKEETRRDTQEKTDQSGQDSQAGFVAVLKRTVEALSDQLKIKDTQLEAKDRQIDSLLERNREMNILLKFLQDKYPALEAPKKRRGRKAKDQPEEPIDITDIRAKMKEEAQEASGAPEEPEKGEEEAKEPAEQAPVATEEAEAPEPEEKEKKPKAKDKKKGFWGKLFTPYTMP